MDLAKVKMVVTDMDGTLLNSNHEVSQLFYQQFEKLKQHNVLFVAASGRPLYSIKDKLSSIQEDIIIVAENGGIVIKEGNILSSNTIKKESIEKLAPLLLSLQDTHLLFCTKDKAYTFTSSQKALDVMTQYYSDYEIITDISDIKEDILKIALYHEIDAENHIYPHLQHLEGDFKVKLSAINWADISEMNSNKGEAIQLLQQLYNITPQETLAFGDYNNDLEMLASAYYSYAMENAHPLVKETANFMTKTNDNNGVEFIIDQLIRAKEQLNSNF
ncbi:HAD family hydrolase [Tenacibaculum agarivorans]|uniref:HAD family hydrolase n=1 Tax=Tenacibaculum agarivorans TaxID=1908389 RepID=UPI00094B850D|nr:HAD family hydrolase [Tenacibaculum agarivorans]